MSCWYSETVWWNVAEIWLLCGLWQNGYILEKYTAQAVIPGNVNTFSVICVQRKAKQIFAYSCSCISTIRWRDSNVQIWPILSVSTQILQMTEQAVLNLPPLLLQKDETLEVSFSGSQNTFSQYLVSASFVHIAQLLFTLLKTFILFQHFFVSKLWFIWLGTSSTM